MTNNLFVNCRQAFSIDARGLGWAKGVGTFATKELLDLNYKQPPWSVRYPESCSVSARPAARAEGQRHGPQRLLGWQVGLDRTRSSSLFVKFENNLIDADPRFAGKPPADFTLAKNSPAWSSSFQPIPREKIGIYQSDDRASWPGNNEH